MSSMKIQEFKSIAEYTTFRIGGPARWFTEAETEVEVVEAVSWARERSVPLFVLGGGSNLLVSDAGFQGLVLHVALKGISSSDEGDSRLYHASAGEDWDGFVTHAVKDNCAGVECLAGIPGTVGGTPVQNVGAYGQEVSETIVRVRVLDLKSLEFVELPAAECQFSYRTSRFNSTAKGRFLVTRVDYRLFPGGPPNLRYADLQRAFSLDTSPALREVTDAVRRIRQAKGMLLVEGDADCQSAGSFFKNPVIPSTQLQNLKCRFGLDPPSYPAGEGMVKIPAAWLIEHAGFHKGLVLGKAGISSRHTLALINLGGATAENLLRLRDKIVAGVQSSFEIELQMEPVLVGF